MICPCTTKLAFYSSTGLENDVVPHVGAATATLIKEWERHLSLRELIWFPLSEKNATVSAKKFSFVGVFIHFYRLLSQQSIFFLYYTDVSHLKATKGASIRCVAKSRGHFDMQRTRPPSPPAPPPTPTRSPKTAKYTEKLQRKTANC